MRLAIALAALSALPIAAQADTFNYTLSSSYFAGLNGSGVLTGTAQGGGAFRIINITGPASFGAISVIAVNDPDFNNDNLLYPTQARLLDVSGLAFSGSFGRVNLFSTVSGYEVQGFDPMGSYFDQPITLSLASTAVTPEPSSLLLSVTGLFATAAAGLRRLRRSAM